MVVMAAAGFSIGLAATMRPDDKPQRGPAMEKPRGSTEKAALPLRARDVKGEPMVVRGRVLDPDGNPAAGADIFFHISRMSAGDPAGARRVGTAGPDGRFELTIPDPTIDPQPVRVAKPPLIGVVTATARGFGPAWAAIHPSRRRPPDRPQAPPRRRRDRGPHRQPRRPANPGRDRERGTRQRVLARPGQRDASERRPDRCRATGPRSRRASMSARTAPFPRPVLIPRAVSAWRGSDATVAPSSALRAGRSRDRSPWS